MRDFPSSTSKAASSLPLSKTSSYANSCSKTEKGVTVADDEVGARVCEYNCRLLLFIACVEEFDILFPKSSSLAAHSDLAFNNRACMSTTNSVVVIIIHM